MFNTQTAPMQKNSTQVHQTKDYAMFSTLSGNRELNPMHLTRLRDSIRQHYLMTIITVNEKFEIIDGQHRFSVCKQLGLPINYVVVPGYGLKEVQILNANSKTWSANDYLNGYCDLNYPEYHTYRSFFKRYGFGHKVNLSLLSPHGSGSTGKGYEVFRNGTFKIANLDFAITIADKIKMISKIYPGAERLTFVIAFTHCVRKPIFNFEEFMDKMRYRSSMLVDCTTTTAYLALIEEIYNYKRKEKVNLRF
jgi:hypothetical protein